MTPNKETIDVIDKKAKRADLVIRTTQNDVEGKLSHAALEVRICIVKKVARCEMKWVKGHQNNTKQNENPHHTYVIGIHEVIGGSNIFPLEN